MNSIDPAPAGTTSTSGSNCGLILFGHGARDPDWARPMQRVRRLLGELAPALPVRLAFLEFLKPTLPQAIDELAASCPACTRVLVLPMFMSQGGHVQRDVPLLLDAARVHHPSLAIELAAPIGESEAILGAIAQHALNLLSVTKAA